MQNTGNKSNFKEKWKSVSDTAELATSEFE